MIKKIIDKAPDIIRESAKSPLGVIALSVLLISMVAIVFFQDSSDVVKGAAFASLAFSLITFVGVAVHFGAEKSQDHSRHDKELFEQFLSIFAKNDRIRFFKEHDFLGSFQKDRIDGLYEFVETWGNAAHEFIDQDVEKKRKDIYESAKRLAGAIAQYTTPNQAGLISVKPDNLPHGPTPDWIEREAKEINDCADEFAAKHEDFIRFCHKKFG